MERTIRGSAIVVAAVLVLLLASLAVSALAMAMPAQIAADHGVPIVLGAGGAIGPLTTDEGIVRPFGRGMSADRVGTYPDNATMGVGGWVAFGAVIAGIALVITMLSLPARPARDRQVCVGGVCTPTA